jgi:hypothetical protein
MPGSQAGRRRRMPTKPALSIWDDPKTVERLIALFWEGLSQSRLAMEFNCSRSAIHGKLERLGLTPGNRDKQTAEPTPLPVIPYPTGVKKTLPPLPSLMGMDLEDR